MSDFIAEVENMKTGPKPIPTAIKRLQGNPGHRPLNGDEPQPEPLESIEPPAHLDDVAKAEWRRLAPGLVRLGLLTECDTALFAGYCIAFSQYVAANEWMRANGSTMTMRDDKGVVKFVQVVPQWNQAYKALEAMRKLGAEFGLTPSARSGLRVQNPKPSSTEWDKFLPGGVA
jgi:P27 family predicted phage terminase small subunit